MDTFLQAAHIGRIVKESAGLPEWLSSKDPACQCRRHRRRGFNPWVGKIPWSRKWQPTPVFLPGEFHEQKSKAGYSPWGRKASDTTKHIRTSITKFKIISCGFYLLNCTQRSRYFYHHFSLIFHHLSLVT